MNIYISFPSTPFEYDRGNRFSWSQIYKFIYNGLSAAFPGLVKIIPYSINGKIPFAKNDIFITTLSDSPIVQNILEFPRTILVDNNNFNVGKWKNGCYEKYGYKCPTTVSSKFNRYIQSSLCEFVKTNDVAIQKWETDHEDIYEYKKWFMDNNVNVKLMQHPIDKEFYGSFYNKDKQIDEVKMIIYHAGISKNAEQLVNLLKYLGYNHGEHYDVVGGINMATPKTILDNYSIFAHTSFSEGFPYLLNELFTMGMFPLANEEWWNGYGNIKSQWSYNPNKISTNIQTLQFLFDKNNIDKIKEMRNELWNNHMNREDNNWSYFNAILVEEIRRHI